MTLSLNAESQIVVADSRPQDYQHLMQLAVQRGWHLHLLTSGMAVLRLTRLLPIDLYLVNTRLPDLSGYDLFEMLRDQVPTAQVFIVSDFYTDVDERRACRCGAALYLCKGQNGCIDFSSLSDFLLTSSATSADSPSLTSSSRQLGSISHSYRVASTPDVPVGGQTH